MIIAVVRANLALFITSHLSRFVRETSPAVNYRIIFVGFTCRNDDTDRAEDDDGEICFSVRVDFSVEGLDDRDVQENVAVHGEQEAVGVCTDLRGGYPAGSSGWLRLSDGINHAGLHRSERLQSHANRRSLRHQGIRHRHTYGWANDLNQRSLLSRLPIYAFRYAGIYNRVYSSEFITDLFQT